MFEYEQYLYLTTIGRTTGNPHEIEIWFVQHDNYFYLISGNGEKSDWVKNIQANAAVTWHVAKLPFTGRARLVHSNDDTDLAAAISNLMNAKYNWSDGLIVELCPAITTT